MKIKLFETVDDKFAKLGFVKTHESDFVVCYERTDSKFGYVQCLELCHKRTGKHMISSFQKGTNRDGFNNSVGLQMREAKLCLKKMKQKGWRDDDDDLCKLPICRETYL